VIAKKTIVSLLACALSVLFLSACERTQVTTYKQGEYQGKKDSQPWDNAKYAGDKTAWESDMRSRNQNQNEYKRTN
jgi:hypothetical protein